VSAALKHIIIIGSGFSSLAAASFLAKAGYEVTVLEKNESAGGRARVFEEKGFKFDMGPSWYWMPDVFENFFGSFGYQVKDFYELLRLSPSYTVFYKNNTVWPIPASVEELGVFLETIEVGASKNLKKFIAEAAIKYKVGINNLVYKPSKSLTEFIDKDFLKNIFKLDVFGSHAAHVRKYFKDPRIISLLEFPVLFLGAKAQDTPALYSLMNYADIQLGTWYPIGGMGKIVDGMVKLATSLGVKFLYHHAVESLDIDKKSVTKVNTNKGSFTCDMVVGGADYQYIDNKIMPPTHRNYSETYWDKRTMAPSSLIFYLGINKKLKNLTHHSLFFDEGFEQHAEEIYDNPKWPTKPLFYVCCPSVTDKTVAPEGQENLFILIPVAPNLLDTEETREKYFDMVLSRLEHHIHQEIKTHVIYKRSYAHNDFISDYNSFKGNAYGLANTLKQTAILKPALKNKNLTNYYYML
jgi:phytoene desaturase